ncbi:MAG: FAD-binding oxidoreductase [Acidimicrobiia bacterium]
MRNPSAIDAVPVDQIRRQIQGQIITAQDPGYDEARTVFFGMFDHRPALIAQVVDANDVATIVKLAGQEGFELAVRSGGHSAAGHSMPDGAVVIDFQAMKAIEIDLESQTAWAESGVTAGEYTAAAGAHGLVTGFGDTASVGIGGITLGGGVGFLVRKYGLTIDDLLGAEVVTAEGELLEVDADNHPDLFWAIRGGGGNFGVVSRFRYRLHEVPEIVGGMLFLPATTEVVSGFLAAAEAADEELSTILNVITAPPMPFLPEEAVGQPIVMAFLAYAGEAEVGNKAVAPFRHLAEPIVDMVRPMTYPEMYMPEEEEYHPVATGRTTFIDEISDLTIERILAEIASSPAMMAACQLRVLGGAMARVPNEATAFGHRRRKLMATAAAMFERPEEEEQYVPWVTNVMRLYDEGYEEAAYTGFLGDEGPERVKAAYPGTTWDRLTEIKRRYDPDNVFHHNQNIPPA